MRSRLRALLASFSLLSSSLIAPAAAQLGPDELDCQREIGAAARSFAAVKLDALVDCNNEVVNGGTCDIARRDAKIARAADAVSEPLARECRDATLAALGFPGTCADPDGGDFSVANLQTCVLDAAEAQIDALLALEFPALASRTGNVERCQRAIGRSGETFFQGKLRARVRCLDLQLRGKVGAAVDCLAEVPPGTGDAKTDRLIRQVADRLADQIGRRCSDAALATLGFPGGCPDATGVPFSVADLQACIHDTHEAAADAIVAVAYQTGAGPVPTVSPTPGGSPVATPSPTNTSSPAATATPGETASPAETSSPGTTATASPAESATPAATATPIESVTPEATASAGTPVPTATPGGPCVLPSPIPDQLSLVAKPGIDLDTGWTGQSHDLPGDDNGALTTVRVLDCDVDLQSPTCGQCGIEGPLQFPGSSKNCRCVNLGGRDASSLDACDPETPSTCTTPETCQCFYGPPLPLSSGAVPVCVVNRYTAPVSGTANIADSGPHSGEAGALIELESAVHNGPTVDRPCPVCDNDVTPLDGVKNGTCDDGAKKGGACDVSGTNVFFGDVSFDCPPAQAANIGNLVIRFNPATTQTTSLATNGVMCTAPGFTALECFCDTCATLAAEPCNSNADCPGVACGGRRCIGGTNAGVACTLTSECGAGSSCGRPGQVTAPNACDDGVCTPDASDPASPNDGVCEAGPFDRLCSIETFRGCLVDGDCNPPPFGSCGSCVPSQVCGGRFRQCFLDPIVRTGMPGTQMSVIAATFCIPPTSAPAVNAVAGLPGPGGLLLPVQILRSGAACGNGVIDTGEQCDPPAADTCLAGCQADCTCAPTCGDNVVNQPSEQCDGTDQGVCTGACQADCTCAPVCGNNSREGTEECDGTDDSACPGFCQGDCTCAPFCGDNVVDPGEECDGLGSTACPVDACRSDCTCGPFCGDGNIDPGEVCDSATTGTCAGTCAADCTCAPFCGNGIVEGGETCDTTADTACPGDCLADCRCAPVGNLSFVVKPGSDLESGWTGQSHDAVVQAGSTIAGELGGCDGATDFDCTFFANVGSFCSGDPSRSCTANTQCLSGQTCVISTYGPPLPLSSGGVPVCVINRFAGDVTGTYNTQSGESTIRVPLNSLVHFSPNVSQPCPVCDCRTCTGGANAGAACTDASLCPGGTCDPPSIQDCTVGQTGTCSSAGAADCTIGATGPFGPTSNDCPPNPLANVSGGGLSITWDPATTGTATRAADQPCDAADATNLLCWCDGQLRPNACETACNGGDNDALACGSNVECPGGTCVALCRQIVGEPVGEGECPAGPADRRCAGAEEIGCQTDASCPSGTGPCVTSLRRCFFDPIVRPGMPGTTMNLFGAVYCVPATTSGAINTNTGLPGPGAVRLPNQITAAFCGDGSVDRASEECDLGDATNCPGACQTDCTCPRTCGNGIVEFGEQCEATSDAACPGQCAADCTCPPVCGDGFVGSGEQCDPGGAGGTPPPSDAACPGACSASCQCPAATCGNGVIEPGETCELPAVGCGALQQCVGCTACS